MTTLTFYKKIFSILNTYIQLCKCKSIVNFRKQFFKYFLQATSGNYKL